MANISDYEEVIKRTEEDAAIDHLMIVSHNPGSHEFSHYLVSDNVIDRFITCSVAMIKLHIDYWGEIDQGVGKLADFFTPHDL